ncbi:MAG: hypothetical protein WC683_03970 [bacterium]
MSYISDTVSILADEPYGTVTRPVFRHVSGAVQLIPPKQTATSVTSTRMHSTPIRAGMTKDARGWVAEATHHLYCASSATVEVGDHVAFSGTVGYLEVLGVDAYEDHKRLWAKRVEGRA